MINRHYYIENLKVHVRKNKNLQAKRIPNASSNPSKPSLTSFSAFCINSSQLFFSKIDNKEEATKNKYLMTGIATSLIQLHQMKQIYSRYSEKIQTRMGIVVKSVDELNKTNIN